MSFISSLVLVLLCSSLHACNARNFGVINKEATNRFFFTTENDDKFNLAKVSIKSDVKSSISTAKKETTLKEKKVEEYNLKTSTKKRVIVPGDTQTDQSMSWRMPHKKRGQKDPGFNLDYLPPKTHPPLHN
ncbi:uncharacterized protein LOC111391693 [Olea europaea var. sylvestris]|uniref:uncharacterized protein LOC111391693 n=1 Tax=Olea europaea var. sylvestris TaxID=158386 RepID=UPI000C1D695A|nr:uncharacterized protein LOC111391693 [Olea europaea var. sylvestris]